MKDIINFNAIVKYLERQNLKIDNKTKTFGNYEIESR